MNSNYDIVIIGAGIIGASTAYKLSMLNKSLRIAVLDKETEPNKHQTGRNSGVIHSGVYYPKDSLKSKNCIEGYHQLIKFLDEHKINYKLTGKLIAAADESEYEELDRLFKNAELVGLNVEYMDASQIKNIDKALVSPKGFFVKETGITDYKEVLNKLIEVSSSADVDFFFNQKITKVETEGSALKLTTNDRVINSGKLVNCAGLQSDRVYELVTGKKSPVTIIPFKGEYFKVDPELYSSDVPIYPVPNRDFPFLGVHLTRMIDNTLKVGPNAVLSFDREGYDGFGIDLKDAGKILANKTLYNIAKKYSSTVISELLKHSSKSYFEQNVKKYWSEFDKSKITGYTCGIRAQATENGQLLNDFRIEKAKNQVHVLNAPSPAATSCLAIADTIVQEIEF
ncbi:MAG: L-2-hydroxyglutarate oxidase [Balneola sp.]